MSSTQLKLHFIVGFIITVNIHSFLINIHDVQRAITNKKSYEMKTYATFRVTGSVVAGR
jgi:hypothetical protein